MKIKSAKYVDSTVNPDYRPKPILPEFAFCGRSNVGKSSLINLLTGRKALAKVSGTPGKTQCINRFEINEEWYLVDLPGYGYAKVSKTSRSKWQGMIYNYLQNNDQLLFVFLLIDSRIPPQKIDLEFAGWMGKKGIPFVIIYTKNDKPNSPKSKQMRSAFEREMLKSWAEMPVNISTSALNRIGQEPIIEFIDDILGLWKKTEV